MKHGCTICGASIEVGETEFEFTSSGIKLFVHGRCFDFWIKGAAASLDDGNRAQGHPRSS